MFQELSDLIIDVWADDMDKQYFVYILGNEKPVLYIGVTNNLKRRISEHYHQRGANFTAQYNTTKLLYYEIQSDSKVAHRREKQLKNWHREWKLNLIKQTNPKLNDLYQEMLK